MRRKTATGLVLLSLVLSACATHLYDGPRLPESDLARIRIMPPLTMSAMDDRKVSYRIMRVLPGRHAFLLHFAMSTPGPGDSMISSVEYHTTAFAVAFDVAAGRDYVISRHAEEGKLGLEVRLHERAAGGFTLRQYAHISGDGGPEVYTARDAESVGE